MSANFTMTYANKDTWMANSLLARSLHGVNEKRAACSDRRSPPLALNSLCVRVRAAV